MGQLIEVLESRQLFSAVPAAAVLLSAEKTAKAEVKLLQTNSHLNFALIEGELKAAGELKASGAALKALASHGTAAFNVISKRVSQTTPVLAADASKLSAAASRLRKKPSLLSLQTAQTAAITKFRGDAASHLNLITNAITSQTSIDKTYADALVGVNSGDANLKTTLSAAGDRSAAARAALASTVSVALTTDVNNLIAGLAQAPTL